MVTTLTEQTSNPKILATDILNSLQLYCSDEALRITTESLNGILYSTQSELFELHYERLKNLLNELANVKSAPKAIAIAQNNLELLAKAKRAYLNRWYSYIQFWSSDAWPQLNLLLLIIPFIIGFFIPPVGIAMLIFTAIYTGTSALDFLVQSDKYWQWQDAPQISEFVSHDEVPNIAMPEPLKPLQEEQDPFTLWLNRFAYYGDLIGVGICIISIVSLALPPVGIPALAMILLTVIAIVIGGIQCGALVQQRNKNMSKIISLATKIAEDKIEFGQQNTSLLQLHVTASAEASNEYRTKKNFFTDEYFISRDKLTERHTIVTEMKQFWHSISHLLSLAFRKKTADDEGEGEKGPQKH